MKKEIMKIDKMEFQKKIAQLISSTLDKNRKNLNKGNMHDYQNNCNMLYGIEKANTIMKSCCIKNAK